MKPVASILAPLALLAGFTGVIFAQTAATKANVDARDKEGRTALMLADDSDKIRSLIAAGADVNAKDNDGTTALMFSARVGVVDLIKILISAGASVNAKDNNGATALMEAVRTEGKLVTRSKNGGWNPVPGFSRAESASVLITAGADVNATDNFGATALMKAREIDCVKLLIARGADVHARNQAGATVLMYLASRQSNPAIVPILVAAGGDINAQDKHGRTALMEASTIDVPGTPQVLTGPGGEVEAFGGWGKGTVGDPELVTALISSGADVNAKDDAGKSVLSLARAQKSSCVGILRKAHAK